MAGIPVTLGGKDYELVPQRIGRIGRKIRQVIELLQAADSGEAPGEISGSFYEALQVFIPDLEPEWKLGGYPSGESFAKIRVWESEVADAKAEHAREWYEKAEPYQRGDWKKPPPFEMLPPAVQLEFEGPERPDDDYDERLDESPTPPEIIRALEVIFEVHGGQRLVRLLKNFISPEAMRAMVERRIETAQINAKRVALEGALLRSRSLQLESGESTPTPSTPTDLTEEEIRDLGSRPPSSSISSTAVEETDATT